MSYLIFFIVSFIIIVLIYNIFVIRKEKALNKMKNSKDVELLLKLSKLKMEDVDIKKTIKLLSVANSFIVSLAGTLILLINVKIENFYLWLIVSMLIGMVLLLPLIIFVYKFIGRRIKKEG